jgi:hypothetical protein
LSFDFKDQNTLLLDVDLPDLKDMPRKTAEIASRGYKLLIKTRTEMQLKKDFCHLIHAIFFRITGEVFSNLPVLQKIIRGTIFSLPVQVQSDKLERMQLLWSGHLRVLGAYKVQVFGLPERIVSIIDELNDWLSVI